MWVISSQQEVQKEQGITDRENFEPDFSNSLRPLNPARNTYSIEFDGSHNVWFIWRDYDRLRRYGPSLGSPLDHGRYTWAKSLFKNCSLATSEKLFDANFGYRKVPYPRSESDMKYFLNSHGVREQFRPGALSVRCFILLMDLNKEHNSFFYQWWVIIDESLINTFWDVIITSVWFHFETFLNLIRGIYVLKKWAIRFNQKSKLRKVFKLKILFGALIGL